MNSATLSLISGVNSATPRRAPNALTARKAAHQVRPVWVHVNPMRGPVGSATALKGEPYTAIGEFVLMTLGVVGHRR